MCYFMKFKPGDIVTIKERFGKDKTFLVSAYGLDLKDGIFKYFVISEKEETYLVEEDKLKKVSTLDIELEKLNAENCAGNA